MGVIVCCEEEVLCMRKLITPRGGCLSTQVYCSCLTLSCRDQIDRPGAAELLEDQFLTVYTGKKDSTSSR